MLRAVIELFVVAGPIGVCGLGFVGCLPGRFLRRLSGGGVFPRRRSSVFLRWRDSLERSSAQRGSRGRTCGEAPAIGAHHRHGSLVVELERDTAQLRRPIRIVTRCDREGLARHQVAGVEYRA